MKKLLLALALLAASSPAHAWRFSPPWQAWNNVHRFTDPDCFNGKGFVAFGQCWRRTY